MSCNLLFSTQEAAPDTASRVLAKQGSKCRGHRHDEVILHQREALAEMRARIGTLEQTTALSKEGQRTMSNVKGLTLHKYFCD